jgi:hypothetical protein
MGLGDSKIKSGREALTSEPQNTYPRSGSARRHLRQEGIRSMRHKTVSIALTLFAGVLLTAAVLRSQMPSAGPQWEYAVVTGSEAKAFICYGASYGCKNDEVRSNDAVMAAAMKLGDKGWELASATESFDRNPSRTLYFKRLKSVINRNEDHR